MKGAPMSTPCRTRKLMLYRGSELPPSYQPPGLKKTATGSREDVLADAGRMTLTDRQSSETRLPRTHWSDP